MYLYLIPLSLSLSPPLSPFHACSAIIISGGPNSVNDEDGPGYDPAIFELGVPILGICYGLQLINVHYGGTVSKKAVREDGQFSVKIEQGRYSFIQHVLSYCVVYNVLERGQLLMCIISS